MKIHELKIEGFKSIGEIALIEPNPFTVFVGPNAAGKSNIFEALEFMQLCNVMNNSEALKIFGGPINIINLSNKVVSNIVFNVKLENVNPYLELYVHSSTNDGISINQSTSKDWLEYIHNDSTIDPEYTKFISDNAYKLFSNFTRLFVNEQKSKVKRNVQDDTRLASDASNLEKVLKRILKDKNNSEEIIELLQLLIPGLSNIEIRTEELSGTDSMIIYENALEKPLTKRIISDGTYNILCIIAAVFQSDEPQFLCIEEPENGLNPKVVRQLVQLFRDKCAEKGHYIWLNTHSQTLVSELTTDEIILVDKVDGLTQIKQVKGMDLHGMRMDDALLTNTLGGGIPW